LVLDVEKTLPSSIRRKYVIPDKVIYPNKELKWLSIISHVTRMEEIQEALNPTKVRNISRKKNNLKYSPFLVERYENK